MNACQKREKVRYAIFSEDIEFDVHMDKIDPHEDFQDNKSNECSKRTVSINHQKKAVLVVDSACSRHLFPQEWMFQSLQICSKPDYVAVADGDLMQTKGNDQVKLLLELENGEWIENTNYRKIMSNLE